MATANTIQTISILTVNSEPAAAFVRDVLDELDRAQDAHAPLHSLHEAYAVILEELDELWEQCRRKREARDPASIRAELVQIAAMCLRADLDVLRPRTLRPETTEATEARTHTAIDDIPAFLRRQVRDA